MTAQTKQLSRDLGELRAEAARIGGLRKGMPDEVQLADLSCLLAEPGDGWLERAHCWGQALCAGTADELRSLVAAIDVTPGVEVLRERFAAVLVALRRQDGHSYRRATKALRLALASLLAIRPAWALRSGDVWFGCKPTGRERGFALVLAGAQAMLHGADELREFQAWYTDGGAVRWHTFYAAERGRRNSSVEPQACWLRQRAAVLLPEAEVAVLIAAGLATAEQVAQADALDVPGGWETVGEKIAEALDAALDGQAETGGVGVLGRGGQADGGGGSAGG
jgi:hypothetical protein